MTPEPLLASFAIRVWITRLGENVAVSLDPMLTMIKPNTLKTASTGRAYQLVCFSDDPEFFLLISNVRARP
ncbi:hypothetical protein [Pseudomonas alkylphenolica]|uniref:hypothetical protein n=1 Tax=Pseudomonas alkylphenolica TaxID=237609 RepID=UPI00315D431A